MWLAIVLAVGLSVFGMIPPLKFELLPVDFLFLTNYLPHWGLPIRLWSLAVEEHFYLLFPPAAMALVARRGASACALVCAVACAIILGVRVEEAGRLSDIGAIGFLTHTRLDSILFGAILALWNNPVIDRENRLPPIATSYIIGGMLLLIGFIIRDETFRFTIRYTIEGAGLLLIFNAAIRDHRIAHRILETAPLKFVGALSYMLYLVHSTFILALAPLAGTIGTLPSILVAFALSFAFAYGARVLMENPLVRWRRTTEYNWRSRRDTTAAYNSSP